jgi:hypothetical protein
MKQKKKKNTSLFEPANQINRLRINTYNYYESND